MTNSKMKMFGAGVALAAVVSGMPALAQEAAPVGDAPAQSASAAAPADTSAADSYGDIIVTANKREQNLQDVGLSIDAIGGDALKSRQISSLADIAQAVPSLSFSNSQNSTPVFTLRGVGFYDTSLAAYPTTSVYIDQVPLPFPVLTTHAAFDLERMEVLKGPQGTLFGNNATGGAINYIAARPTSTFAAGAQLGYARFNTVTAEAFVSGPLSETLSARVAGKLAVGDGWQKSYTRDDRNGKTRNYAGRILLDWDPADGVGFQLNVNAWQDKGEPQAPQFIASIPQFAPGNPLIANYPIAPRDNRAADWSTNVPPSGNNRFFQASLRSDFALADDIELTAISSYIRYRHRQFVEGDGTIYNGIDIFPNRGSINSFSQEIRLSNGARSAFRWVAGVNYSSDKVYENNSNIFDDSSAAATLAIRSLVFESHQKMSNYAAFANAEFDIADALTLKAGIRYTQADRSADFCSSDPITGTTNVFFTNLAALASGQAVSPILPTECYPLGPDNLPARVPVERELNEDNISWRVGADWKAADDLLIYANVSRGYKAGGFPTLSASSTSQYVPVTQESVLAYEAGVKWQSPDRSVTINGAAFYYDYSDKQIKSRTIDAVFGPLDILQNIPKSSVRGAEIEVNLRPVEGLSLQLAGTYSDARVDEFTGVNGAGQVADFAGARVPFSPKWRGLAAIDYSVPVSSDLSLFAGATLSGQSKSVSVIGGTGLYRMDGYALLDLRAGIASDKGKWRLSMWGKNVTNKFYANNIFAGNDEVLRYTGRPVTYGVTFSIEY